MHTELIAMIGAGGHGKVVYEACLVQTGGLVEVFDDNPALNGLVFLGTTVRAPVGDMAKLPIALHVAIGNCASRRRVGLEALAIGKTLVSVIHPCAIISNHASVAPGVFVAAGAIVSANAKLSVGAIVNHGAVVDHDCEVGAWSHVAPQAVLGGGSSIGEGVMLGAGSVVLPGVRIGNWALVGAGAVVIRDVPAGFKMVGVPATAIGEK